MNIPYAFKKCSKCGEWKVANNYNFRKNKSCKWGLYSQCKKCEKGYSKQYYENNKEHLKGYSKQYRKDNKEYCKEYGKQWREDNKEYKKELDKQYYENNKEHLKGYSKQYYENNKEHHNEYGKQWRKDNKEYCKEYGKQWRGDNPEKCFNYKNERRSKLENQGRGIDKIQWQEMFDFFKWKCAYSNISLGYKENRSIDHIVALDNGGLNEPWNLVPMYLNYNSSKNKRVDVINWYMEQEYFDIDRLNKIVEWQIYAYEKWGGEEFGELILITDLFEEEK